jgi:hypothetical protein
MGPKGAPGMRGLPGPLGELFKKQLKHFHFELRHHAWLIKFISNSKFTFNAIKSKDQLELIVSRE